MFAQKLQKDVERKLDTSKYQLDRQLLKGRNKNINALKDELVGKTMTVCHIDTEKI